MAKKIYELPKMEKRVFTKDIVTASGSENGVTYGSFDPNWVPKNHD